MGEGVFEVEVVADVLVVERGFLMVAMILVVVLDCPAK